MHGLYMPILYAHSLCPFSMPNVNRRYPCAKTPMDDLYPNP